MNTNITIITIITTSIISHFILGFSGWDDPCAIVVEFIVEIVAVVPEDSPSELLPGLVGAGELVRHRLGENERPVGFVG